MKKLFSVLMVVLMVFQIFSGGIVSALPNTDIQIVSYSTSKDPNPIYKDDTFTFNVSIKNNTAGNINNVYLIIDQTSSFYATGSNMVAFPGVPIATTLTSATSVTLKYKGEGKTLNFSIAYNDGAAKESTHTVYLNAIPESTTPSTPTDTTKYKPVLSIVGDSQIPTAVAGSAMTLSIPVKNTSTHTAKSVVLSLDSSDTANYPFVLDTLNLTKTIDQIANNETKTITYPLKVNPNQASGLYTLKVKIRYINLFNDAYESTETLYVKIENNHTAPKVIVTRVDKQTQPVVPNTSVKVNFTLKNTGTLTAKNVKVSMKGLDSKSFTMVNSTDIKYPGDITGLGSKTVEYNLHASKEISSGNHALSLRVDYEDAAGKLQSEEYQFFIETARPDDGISNLVLTEIQSPTKKMIANQDFTISFGIKNQGSMEAKNIRIKLNTDNVLVSKSLNPKIIDSLATGKTTSLSYTFTVAPEAVTKNYSVEITVEYDVMEGGKAQKYSLTQYVGVMVDTSAASKTTPPKVIVAQIVKPQAPVQPNASIKVGFTLKNIGTLRANNIKVSIKGMDPKGFTMEAGTDTQYIENLVGLRMLVSEYSLHASKDITAGKHALSLRVDYEDATGKQYSEECQFFLEVEKPQEGKSNVVLSDIQSPTGIINVNQDFTVRFNLQNKGTREARNVKIKLNTDSVLVSKTLNPKLIDRLAPNESVSVSYVFSFLPEAITKSYPIEISIEYDDMEGGKTEKQSLLQYAGVFVEKEALKDPSKVSVPRLIIQSYDFGGEAIRAGQKFDIQMAFLNTSALTKVSNLKITLSSDDGTYTVEGSNTFYVEEIASKGMVDKTYTITAKGDAPQKSYPLTVNFEFEDQKGTQYTSKDVLSIPIIQETRLVIGEANVAPEAFANQPASVFVEFYNMGKSTLYNLMITIEGDFGGQKSNYYVGNFDAGRSDSYDGMVTPMMAGASNGFIVFTYEDATGNQIQEKKEFTLNVMDMPVFEEFPMDMKDPMEIPSEQNSSNKIVGPFTLLHLIFIGIGLIAVITVIVLLRKRHKRKKEMMFNELS